MADLFQYVFWRGDLPLSAVPLCDVDALLFARLAYIPFEGVVPAGFGDYEIISSTPGPNTVVLWRLKQG